MIRTFFKIAFRKFKRNRFFTLINILGLGIGISASLVIYLIVQHEFNYDKFEKDNSRIYRVVSDLQFPGGTKMNIGGVPFPLPDAVRSELTGIETVTHLVSKTEAKVIVTSADKPAGTEYPKQGSIGFVDEFYLPLIGYKVIAGDKSSLLKKPFEVVLTESRAAVYFGKIPVDQMIGRVLKYDDSLTMTVTGIVGELKSPTTFQFQELISIQTISQTGLRESMGGSNWGGINSDCQVFVKLLKGTGVNHVDAGLAQLRKKYVTVGSGDTDRTVQHLQPLSDIHFSAMYEPVSGDKANKGTLYGLLAVAGFLLLIGCINFINLTTAQSSLRAKEIGIRKAAGSTTGQLVVQFLSETFVLTLCATLFSIAITPFLIRVFGDYIPEGIGFHSIGQVNVALFLLILLLVVTFLSGFYPALVLTRYNPVDVLKGPIVHSHRGSKLWLRKSLTITQFVIAQLLIIATLVVSKQVRFSINKDLGFKKDAIVVVQTPWSRGNEALQNKKSVLLNQIAGIPEIERVALGGSSPASNGWSSGTMIVDDGGPSKEFDVQMLSGDTNYYKIYQLKLLAGKWMAQSDTTREYIINETFARQAGFTNPKDAVGHYIRTSFAVPIVGVVGDFHTKSTQMAIPRIALTVRNKQGSSLHVALRNGPDNAVTWKRAIEKIEKLYKNVYPGEEFHYSFFDESIADFYQGEQNISRLLSWASGLCIFISALGMLGLVIYVTNLRTKEIGLRKVLGASVMQIMTLISKEFIYLILIAFVVAVPVAYWFMYRWLEDYKYRTPLSWWIFGITGVSMLALSMLILGLRTVKAARQKAADLLKTE